MNGVSDLELKTLFQQEAVRRGVLYTASFNCTLSHGQAEFEKTKTAFSAAFERCAEAIERGTVDGLLEGTVIEPVFRKP
jgi:hypothetical protein